MQPALYAPSFLFYFNWMIIQTNSVFEREVLLLFGFFSLPFYSFRVSQAESRSVAQADLNLLFLEPQLAFCWDFKRLPPHLGLLCFWRSVMPRNKGSLELDYQSWSVCHLSKAQTHLIGHDGMQNDNAWRVFFSVQEIIVWLWFYLSPIRIKISVVSSWKHGSEATFLCTKGRAGAQKVHVQNRTSFVFWHV